MTLNTAIQFLHKTLWLMIMYHQTKFLRKRISSSEDIVETVTSWSMSPCCDLDLEDSKPYEPCCDLDLEDSKPIFCMAIPAYDNVSPYQVWLQNSWRLRRSHVDKHIKIFWTPLCCDLDLECTNPFLLWQDTLDYNDVPLDQVWLAKIQQFWRYSRKSNSFPYHTSPHCNLDLKDSKQIFLHDTRTHGAALQYHVW